MRHRDRIHLDYVEATDHDCLDSSGQRHVDFAMMRNELTTYRNYFEIL